MNVNRNKNAKTRAKTVARVLGRLPGVVVETKMKRSARKRARDGKTRAVVIAASHLEMTRRVKNKRRASPSHASITYVPNCTNESAFGRKNWKILVVCGNRMLTDVVKVKWNRGITLLYCYSIVVILIQI